MKGKLWSPNVPEDYVLTHGHMFKSHLLHRSLLRNAFRLHRSGAIKELVGTCEALKELPTGLRANQQTFGVLDDFSLFFKALGRIFGYLLYHLLVRF